jgi:type I restriction enzyme S subunit
MGSEWRSTTLGQVVEEGGGFIQTGPFGSQLHASDYVAKGIPTIMPANMANNRVDITGIARITEEDAERLSKHIVQPDDIVYSRRGDVTLKALIRESDEKMICGTGCLLVRPGKGIDPKFLTYHLSSPQNQEWIIRHAIGATMPNLNQGILSNVPLHVPSISIQKAIAHILGTLDDKIELNRQMNATLEAMAQALFQSWFVDFDPVIDNALAAGHPIPDALQERAAARAALGHRRQPLPAAIQSQFPSGFVRHEEMGWVPEGWAVSTIGHEIQAVGGGTPSTKDASFWEDGVHAFCTPKDMSLLDSLVLTAAERQLTDAGVAQISSGQLPAGVVLLSSRAPIGYLAISHIPVSVNQGIIAMLPNANYEPLYLVCWVRFNMDKILDRANGSTFLEISKKNFAPIPFLVPNRAALDSYNLHAKTIYEKLLLLAQENEKLITLRDTLLPKLLSGAVRVAAAG